MSDRGGPQRLLSVMAIHQTEVVGRDTLQQCPVQEEGARPRRTGQIGGDSIGLNVLRTLSFGAALYSGRPPALSMETGHPKAPIACQSNWKTSLVKTPGSPHMEQGP